MNKVESIELADQQIRKKLNKWLVIALVFVVHMFAIGIPWTVMPVLFSTAADELHLSIAEIGLLWSALPVGAALVAVPGGMLGDRIGFTKSIGIGCLAVAIANGLRGLSANLPVLTISMLLTGASVALIFPNLQRIAALFFPRKQLGLATGISISGFAVGGVLSTALSATVVMPALGGWRNVLFLYSVFCVIVGGVWFFIMRRMDSKSAGQKHMPGPPFSESIKAVLRTREVWLLSIGNLGVVGSYISLNGYLPVFLEKLGLDKSVGDTMTSTLFVASVIGNIAIPALADRIGAMKAVMIASAVITAASILLLSLANTALFWVLIPLAGCLAQGVGTLVVASAVQVKSIAAYAGTALGLIGGLANFGGFVLPLVGGRLAEVNQTWPFILWAAAALAGTVCLFMLREQPRGSKQQPI